MKVDFRKFSKFSEVFNSDFFEIISHGFITASQVPLYLFLCISHNNHLVVLFIFTAEDTELQSEMG